MVPFLHPNPQGKDFPMPRSAELNATPIMGHDGDTAAEAAVQNDTTFAFKDIKAGASFIIVTIHDGTVSTVANLPSVSDILNAHAAVASAASEMLGTDVEALAKQAFAPAPEGAQVG